MLKASHLATLKFAKMQIIDLSITLKCRFYLVLSR